MSFIIKPKQYELPPPGLKQGVLCDVQSVGKHWSGRDESRKLRDVCVLSWQLSERNSSGIRFVIDEMYTATLANGSNLKEVVESWIGRSFTPEEQSNGFDIESLIGKNCYINLIHKPNAEGKIYPKVSSITPIPDSIDPIEIENYTPNAWIADYRSKAVSDEDLPF